MNGLSILKETTDENSSRYKHLVTARAIANELINEINLDSSLKEKILNTVLLHDIGYSDEVGETGYHSYDGYVHLNKNYDGVAFTKCILLHSDFQSHAPKELQEEVDNAYDSLSELEHIVLSIIDYCDIHSNGYGERVTVSERWDDLRTRYRNNPKRMKEIEQNEAYAYHVEDIIKYSLNKLRNI